MQIYLFEKFHQNNLANLIKFGYQVNYIPFLKNPKNVAVKNQMLNLFCISDNEEKVRLINEAFLSPQSFKHKKIEECNKLPYVHNLLTITNYFGFKGTPAILLYNGNYVEGFVEFQSLVLELEGNR